MPVPQAAEPQRQLLRERTYEKLRDAIVRGVLEPGEQLRDADLSRWLGVSRTPIREGLTRLERAGLVVTRPGHSTTVAPVDPRATRDAHQVVTAMHELAVRLAVPRMDRDDVDRMTAANQRFATAISRGDVDTALAADDEVHIVPVRAAGNDALRRVLEQYTPVLRRAERLRFVGLHGHESVELHTRLIDACRQRDVAAAMAANAAIWDALGAQLNAADPTGHADRSDERLRADDPAPTEQ